MSSKDPWEKIRFATLDQLITHTKLNGSASSYWGHTTPEGWPYIVLLAVGSPQNMPALHLVANAQRDLAALVPPTQTDNPGATPAPGSQLTHQMVGSLKWIRQTVHQVHHGDRELEGCESSVCSHISDLLGERK